MVWAGRSWVQVPPPLPTGPGCGRRACGLRPRDCWRAGEERGGDLAPPGFPTVITWDWCLCSPTSWRFQVQLPGFVSNSFPFPRSQWCSSTAVPASPPLRNAHSHTTATRQPALLSSCRFRRSRSLTGARSWIRRRRASASAPLSVSTENDEAVEDASTLAAMVSSGTGYTVDGASGSAEVRWWRTTMRHWW